MLHCLPGAHQVAFRALAYGAAEGEAKKTPGQHRASAPVFHGFNLPQASSR
jgi:hypothetical protein